MARKNDWVATMLYNQPSSFDEVIANGITPDNSQILSKDEYRNKEAIQEAFTEDGVFNEIAFDNFYNSALSMYNEFSHEDWTSKLVSDMDKDPLDWTQPLKTNIKDVSVKIKNGNNPERRSMSITGIGSIGDPVFSIREIAQDNNVRDINGNKLDWTPNSKGIMSIFEPTLALATYDEDGFHIENGIKVSHKKGDYKIDENGDFYYEELGNREGYDKEILRISDVLTTDGSTLNKFDVFDSDGLTKSAASIIAKTAIQFAPYLIPGVRTVAGALGAAFNMASVMPNFAKTINSLINGSNDNDFGNALNKIDNWFGRFDDTTSDKSKQNFLSLENIGNMLSSSAKQLYQQKSLANLSKILYKNDSLRNHNVGQIISLGYMAATSSGEVYDDFKRAGASDVVAGLGMLASTAALYGLLNRDFFKDHLFKGTFLDESEAVDVVKNFNSKEIIPAINKLASVTSNKKDNLKAFNRLHDWFSEKWPKFLKSPYSGKVQATGSIDSPSDKIWSNGLRVLNRSINEGIEETMEEVTFDAIKATSVALDALGIPVTEDPKVSLDFGFSAEDVLARYATSFLGGALGGAVFEGLNIYERIGSKEIGLHDLKSTQQMVYMITTGRAQELRDAVDSLYKKGKLGNKNLAAVGYSHDSNGNLIWKQGTDSDNQNEYAKTALLAEIDRMEAIIQKHALHLMGAQIGNMMGGEFFREEIEKQEKIQKDEGIDSAEYTSKYKTNALIKTMERFKLHTTYINEINDLGAKLVEAETELYKLSKNEDDSKKQESVKFWNNRIKELQQQRDDILQGKSLHKYVFQTQFVSDPSQHDAFMGSETSISYKAAKLNSFWNTSIEGFVKTRYNKNFSQLSDVEKNFYKKEYEEYLSGDFVDQMIRAANLKYKLGERLSPALINVMDVLKDKNLDNYHAHDQIVRESSDFEEYENAINSKYQLENDLVKIQSELTQLETENKIEDERYVGLLTEEAEVSSQLHTLDQIIAKYHSLYGIESYEDISKILLEESITEEGKQNLYNSVSSILTELTTLGSWVDIQNELNNAIEASTGADPNDPVDYQGNIDKWSNALNSYNTNTKNLMDEVLAYYTHLKNNSLVSNNTMLLNKVFEFGLKPIIKTLNQRINDFSDKITDVLPIIQDESSEADFNNIKVFIQDIINNLISGNYNSALDVFYKASDYINEIYNKFGIEQDAVEDFKNAISLLTNNTDYISFLEKVQDLRKQITTFSIADLLSNAELDIDGNVLNIIKLLEDEQKDLSIIGLDSFLIQNPVYLNALKQIPQLLQIVATTIASAYDGTNEFINKYRSYAEIDPLAQGMSESSWNIIRSDLDFLIEKTQVLLDLHENNSMKKKQFHKQSEIKYKTDFVKKLLFERNNADSFIKKLSNGLGVEIEKLLKESLQKYNISIEEIESDRIHEKNFKDFNKALIDFGDALYDSLDHDDESYINYGKALAELLPNNSYTLPYGEITDDKNVYYSDLSACVYLAALIGYKASNFYNKLKKVGYTNSKFVPIVGQEINTQIGVASIMANQLFNSFVENLGLIKPDDLNGSKKDYLINRPVLKNFFFVRGSAGSGKTKVVAKYIKEILKLEYPDAEIIVSAPMVSQTSNIKQSINVEKDITFDELLEKIYPGYKTKNVIDENSHLVYETKPNLEKDSLFENASKTKILILDETTFISSRNLKLLSEWAEKNNIKIIGLGDRKQSGWSEKLGNGETVTTHIEDCIYISGPELTESLRVANLAKHGNLSKLNAFVSSVIKKHEESPWLEPSELDNLVSNLLKVKLSLTYNESSKKHFVGEKFISKNQIEQYIDEFLYLSSEARKDLQDDEKLPSVAFITDDDKKYAFLESKGVKVLSPKSAQGGEFDYVIVNKNFNFDDSLYRGLRDFYTTASRSRIGTVIVDDNKEIRSALNIESTPADNSIVNEPTLFIENSDEHKKWKAELLDVEIQDDDSDDGVKNDEDSKNDDEEDENNNEEQKLDKDTDVKKAAEIILKGSNSEIDKTTYEDFDGESNPVDDNDDFEEETTDKVEKKVLDSSVPISNAYKNREKENNIQSNYSRELFIDIINKNISDLTNENILTLWGVNDKDNSKLKQFITLFSSAVMYNMQIESRHFEKLIDGIESVRVNIDKIVNDWNTTSRYFIAEYNNELKHTVIYYNNPLFKIPVAIFKQRIQGSVVLPVDTALFTQKIAPYGIDTALEDKYFNKSKSHIKKGATITGSTHVPIVDITKHGFLYSKNKLFSPIEKESIQESNYFQSDHNKTFFNANKGKSFTVWSDCELLTDEDIDEIFKYQYDKNNIKNFYIDAVPIQVKINKLQPGIAYKLNNGVTVILVGNQRSITIGDAYDLSCIVKYIAGHIPYKKLSDKQKNLFEGDDKISAINYVKSIIGNFEYDLLDSLANKELRSKSLAANIKKLRYNFRLMNAPDLLIGHFASSLNILSQQSPIHEKAEKQFYRNIIGYLADPMPVKSGAHTITKELIIHYKINNEWQSFIVQRQSTADTKSKLKIFKCEAMRDEKGNIKKSYIKPNSVSFVKEIDDIGIDKKTSFNNILTAINPDFKQEDLASRDLNILFAHETNKNGKTYHDTEMDYDYFVTLLKNTQVDLVSLEKVFRTGDFKNGIYVNDKGAEYKPGTSNEDDPDKTAWREQELSGNIQLRTSMISLNPSIFELSDKIEFKEESSSVENQEDTNVNNEAEIFQFQKELVSLLHQHIDENFENDKDKNEFYNDVQAIFDESNKLEDPFTFIIERVNNITKQYGKHYIIDQYFDISSEDVTPEIANNESIFEKNNVIISDGVHIEIVSPDGIDAVMWIKNGNNEWITEYEGVLQYIYQINPNIITNASAILELANNVDNDDLYDMLDKYAAFIDDFKKQLGNKDSNCVK